MNFRKICVFDFETDGVNPTECNPVQIGAVIVDPRKLELIKDAHFNSGIRPEGIDEDDYFENHKNTIEWHSRISKCSVDDILEQWKNNPAEKDVWESFLSWLSKYHTKQTRQTIFTAPLAAGDNIEDFDLPIIKRLATKYGNIQKDGTPKIFNPRDHIDMLKQAFWWFENQDEPQNYTMDTLREYFGMSDEDAHDALVDVKDTATLMIKFLKTQRWVTQHLLDRNRLKGALSNEKVSVYS